GGRHAGQPSSEQLSAGKFPRALRPSIHLSFDRVAGADAPAVIFLRVLDIKKLVAILRGRLRIERSAMRPCEVFGRHWRTIRPFRVRTQMKRVDPFVGPNVPSLGNAGQGRKRLWIPGGQALKDAFDNPALDLTGRDR